MNVLVSVTIIFIYTSFQDIFLELYSSVSFFRHLISRYAGDLFTGRNEVVAKVMFLLVSVILSTVGVLSQHALQLVSGGGACSGGSALGGCLVQRGSTPGGRLLPGGSALGGSAPRGCGLLLWPSGVAFWFGGLPIEGGLLVESGLLLWPSDVIFCYGLLM